MPFLLMLFCLGWMLAGANGRFLVLGLLWVWPIPEALEALRSSRPQPTQLTQLSPTLSARNTPTLSAPTHTPKRRRATYKIINDVHRSGIVKN